MEKILNELKEILQPFIGGQEISEKENLFDALESLELVRFVIIVEDKYQIEINPEEVYNLWGLAKIIDRRI